MHDKSKYYGIYRGIVVNTADPKNYNRILLKVPQVSGEEVTSWAWPNFTPGIGQISPSVGSNVWVAFEGGDTSYPMWFGSSTSTLTNGTPVPITGNLIPNIDNTYILGDLTHRWKSLFLGPGTLNITDDVTGVNAAISVSNGVFFINGIAQAQLPNIKVTNLTFNDGTLQTTAYVDPTPTAYSPVFSSSGGTSQIAFTGTPATGSYMKQGKLVHFRIKVLYTTMTAFGTGNGNQYFITLPFAPTEKYTFRNAVYEKFSNGNHYELSAHATAGLTTMALYHSAGGGNEVLMNHSAPTSPSTTDYFYLSGTYEAQ
jgi:hypothetical protein